MAVAIEVAAFRRTTRRARLVWLQVVTTGARAPRAPGRPGTGPAPRPARRRSHRGATNGRDLQRRVLLREVQGEAAGRGPGRRDQRPTHGQGHLPGLRDEPEP